MRTQPLISNNELSHSYVNADGSITPVPLVYKPYSEPDTIEPQVFTKNSQRSFFKIPKWLKEFFNPANFSW